MKTFLLVFVSLATLCLTSACNTVEGFGKDVKSAGEAISGSSEKTKEKMSDGNRPVENQQQVK